jgi:probable rRNA maturation factor
MPITIDASAGPRGIATPLRALVALTLKREGRRTGEIGVRLTDDTELRELNRRWRKMDRATDVITFAYDEDAPDAATRPVTGDIVVSMERVLVQAKRYKDTPGTELARLVIHGVLHLVGHDHLKAAERRDMRAREDGTLAAARVLVRKIDAAGGAVSRTSA